ncbi:unnamed protein product [Caenorhabditis angaria]|uniref:Uncharacterized protein n=1 Tax=Caenorhabditis angaria TaxID=860376 RepID=A0A9P1N066_9PELO|nr:unnamed protein product [Caenorhabditis angaria]
MKIIIYVYQVFLLLLGIFLGITIFRCLKANTIKLERSREIPNSNNLKTNENEIINISKPHVHQGESEVADEIAKSMRIFCIIVTDNMQTKFDELKKMWISRCDNYVFMTQFKNDTIPSININVTNPSDIWSKTKNIYDWVIENNLNDYDWFIKVEAETYIVMENLRFLLLSYSTDEPLRFGCDIYRKSSIPDGSGVFSREAVKRISKIDVQTCHSGTTLNIPECMKNVGIITKDSRDTEYKNRFIPFMTVSGNVTNKQIIKYAMWLGGKTEPKCCSDYVILFSGIQIEEMYVLEYLIYHLKPYGVDPKFEQAENKSILETARLISKSEIVPSIINENN